MNELNSLTLNEKTYDRFGGNLPKPATAKVGQVLVVAAVDDEGNVTEVEAVDHSGGGAAPFCVVSVRGVGGYSTINALLPDFGAVSVTAKDYTV
jgi:hypothetical protein